MIFAKRFILDIWQGSEHASAIYTTINIRRLPIRGGWLAVYWSCLIYSTIYPLVLCTFKSMCPYVQHICWITEIIRRVS